MGNNEANRVVDKFIKIATQYGESVSGIIDAVKQWKRQYENEKK